MNYLQFKDNSLPNDKKEEAGKIFPAFLSLVFPVLFFGFGRFDIGIFV